MSIISKMQVSVNSKDLLKRALTRMGYKFAEDKTQVEGRYGRMIDVELYTTGTSRPIGFKKNADGKYEAEADWMEAGVSGQKFSGELNETVAKIKVEDACRMKNITVTQWTKDKAGNMVMVGSQWV
jgi:hypothetical protein